MKPTVILARFPAFALVAVLAAPGVTSACLDRPSSWCVPGDATLLRALWGPCPSGVSILEAPAGVGGVDLMLREAAWEISLVDPDEFVVTAPGEEPGSLDDAPRPVEAPIAPLDAAVWSRTGKKFGAATPAP